MDKKKELGFETILNGAVANAVFRGVSEENYCPDCYDCNVNCEECDE